MLLLHAKGEGEVVRACVTAGEVGASRRGEGGVSKVRRKRATATASEMGGACEDDGERVCESDGDGMRRGPGKRRAAL